MEIIRQDCRVVDGFRVLDVTMSDGTVHRYEETAERNDEDQDIFEYVGVVEY